jgi:hypothetical protein
LSNLTLIRNRLPGLGPSRYPNFRTLLLPPVALEYKVTRKVRPPFTFYTVLRLTLWLDTSLRFYAIPQSYLPLPSTYDISTYFRPSYTPSDLPALSYYDIHDTSSSDASLCSVNAHSYQQEAQFLVSARTLPTPGKLISTMHSPRDGR